MTNHCYVKIVPIKVLGLKLSYSLLFDRVHFEILKKFNGISILYLESKLFMMTIPPSVVALRTELSVDEQLVVYYMLLLTLGGM